MKKTLFLITLIFSQLALTQNFKQMKETIHQFELTDLSGEKFDQGKYDKLKLKPTQCSHVISIGVKKTDKVPEIEDIEAVACAVQNMYLTARAYGIGAYWGSGGVTYKKEANLFFDLEKDDTLLGFFFMGYPSVDFPKGNRKPIGDKVTWVED